MRKISPKQVRILFSLAAVAAVLLAAFSFQLASSGPQKISTDKAMSLIKSGSVKAAAMYDGANRLKLTTSDGVEQQADYPRDYAATVMDELLARGVTVETIQPVKNWLVEMLGTLLPIGILLAFLALNRPDLLKRGKFAAPEALPSARFADVAGATEAVAQLQELVHMRTQSKKYAAMGAKPPRGAILIGPSGTGKTLLARAFAGESGLPFYAVAGSDFVELYAGQGARRVRRLFDAARKSGGVVFIDEMDAVGQNRDGLTRGGDGQERLSVVTALLDAMDGFTGSENVFVLGATNRIDSMDPAVLRPGRLDRKIQVPLPDRAAREAILALHLKGKPLASPIDLRRAAAQTTGMSGAEIQAVVNEACISAVRDGAAGLTNALIEEAINVSSMGLGRESAHMTERDKRVTARHEAGHAACALLLERQYPRDAIPPTYATIIPRGAAGGFTRLEDQEATYASRRALHNRLTIAMAGRAAEALAFGEDGVTTGASGDLKAATELAREMVLRWGLAEDGSLSYALGGSERHDAAVESLLAQALENASNLLGTTEGASLVNRVEAALLEHESLDGPALQDLQVGRAVEGIAA